jgi:hypothetical protein
MEVRYDWCFVYKMLKHFNIPLASLEIIQGNDGVDGSVEGFFFSVLAFTDRPEYKCL